ncbi:MAG TPA: hypothetical protein VFJ85_02155 [Acidimicrobiales bacterium]|nr:hypothetical protein [Acidimicrobiales bacterium]
MPRRRGQDGDDEGFAAPLPVDEEWMDALRDENDDDEGIAGPGGQGDLRRVVEEQRRLLAALGARVEALEAEVARLRRRPESAASLAALGRRAAGAAARMARQARPPH